MSSMGRVVRVRLGEGCWGGRVAMGLVVVVVLMVLMVGGVCSSSE